MESGWHMGNSLGNNLILSLTQQLSKAAEMHERIFHINEKMTDGETHCVTLCFTMTLWWKSHFPSKGFFWALVTDLHWFHGSSP